MNKYEVKGTTITNNAPPIFYTDRIPILNNGKVPGMVWTGEVWMRPTDYLISKLPFGAVYLSGGLLALLITLVICRRTIWK